MILLQGNAKLAGRRDKYVTVGMDTRYGLYDPGC